MEPFKIMDDEVNRWPAFIAGKGEMVLVHKLVSRTYSGDDCVLGVLARHHGEVIYGV